MMVLIALIEQSTIGENVPIRAFFGEKFESCTSFYHCAWQNDESEIIQNESGSVIHLELHKLSHVELK